MNELGVWVHELVDRLSREPGPGLLSAALHDDGPDGPVSKTVAEANALLLMIAGHDSTVNTISNCIMTMLRSPGSWDLVAGNRDLIPRTVEEVQRLQGSVQFFPSRWATADIEIAGTRIPAGSAVFLVWAAANRDPADSPFRTVSTRCAKTTSTSASAAVSTPASAGRWRDWRSTPPWRCSCAG